MRHFLRSALVPEKPWEAVASVLIIAGVLMLISHLSRRVTYSFSVILAGTVMYLICGHFKD